MMMMRGVMEGIVQMIDVVKMGRLTKLKFLVVVCQGS